MVSFAAPGAGHAHPTTPMPSSSESYWSGRNIKALFVQGMTTAAEMALGAAFIAIGAAASIAYVIVLVSMLAFVVFIPMWAATASYSYFITMVPSPVAAIWATIVGLTVLGMMSR